MLMTNDYLTMNSIHVFQSSLAGISLELERHENLPVRIEVIVR